MAIANRNRKRRKRQGEDDGKRELNLRDIKLARPNTAALKRAIVVLHEHRDKARKAKNVSQMAVVGAKHEDMALDEICHACLSSMISDPAYLYDKPRKERGWAVQPREPKKGETRHPYRYLVGWSNHQLKEEYHAGNTAPHKGARKRAIEAFYVWFANKSHWSRFFVGPKGKRSLYDYGYILDLSAPSFVVHVAAVAMRMPGEYVEMMEQWHHLAVVRGIDPHLAFAVVQKVIGFDAETLTNFCPNGHSLFRNLNVQGVARLATGNVRVSSHKADDYGDMAEARKNYNTSSNRPYTGKDEYDYNGLDWLAEAIKIEGLGRTVERPGLWGNEKVKSVELAADAFSFIYSPGWLWLLGEIANIRKEKGWE